MCKKYINHENYEITAIPEFSGEDVVEEVRMVSIKDLALVEVWFKLAQVPTYNLYQPTNHYNLDQPTNHCNLDQPTNHYNLDQPTNHYNLYQPANQPRKNWKKEAKIF